MEARLLPEDLRVIIPAPMCAGRAVDGASSRTSVARTTSMLTKSLLQCRACRLTWFPTGGAGAACPACGGTRVGGTLELFHVGIALIALGAIGIFTYAAFHIDEAFDSGTTTHHHQTPGQHGNAGKGSAQ